MSALTKKRPHPRTPNTNTAPVTTSSPSSPPVAEGVADREEDEEHIADWLVEYTTLLAQVAIQLGNHARQIIHSTKRICALSSIARKLLFSYRPHKHGSDPRLLLLLVDLAALNVGAQNTLSTYKQHLAAHQGSRDGSNLSPAASPRPSSTISSINNNNIPQFDCTTCSAASLLTGRVSTLLEEARRAVEAIIGGFEKYADTVDELSHRGDHDESWVDVQPDLVATRAKVADNALLHVLEGVANALVEGMHDLNTTASKEDEELIRHLTKPQWNKPSTSSSSLSVSAELHSVQFPATHSTVPAALGGGYTTTSKCRKTCPRAVIEERVAMVYDLLCTKSPSDIALGLRGPSVETVQAREWAEGNEQLVGATSFVSAMASPTAVSSPQPSLHSRTSSVHKNQDETEGEDDNSVEAFKQKSNLPLQLLRTFIERAENLAHTTSLSPPHQGGAAAEKTSAATTDDYSSNIKKTTRMWVGGKGTDSVVVVEDTSRNITRLWNRMMSRVQLRGQTGQGCINLAAHVIRGTSWVLGQRAQETHREVSLYTTTSSNNNNPIELISLIIDHITKTSSTTRAPPMSHQTDDSDVFSHFMVSMDCALIDRVLTNHQGTLAGLKRELLSPVPSWQDGNGMEGGGTINRTSASSNPNAPTKAATVVSTEDMIDSLRHSSQTNLQLNTALINLQRTLYTVCAYSLIRCFRVVDAEAWIHAIPSELRPPAAQLMAQYCAVVRSPQRDGDVREVLANIERAAGLDNKKNNYTNPNGGIGGDPMGHVVGSMTLMEHVIKTYLAQATSAHVSTIAALEVAEHGRSPLGRSRGLTYPDATMWSIQHTAVSEVCTRLVVELSDGAVPSIEALLEDGYPIPTTSTTTLSADSPIGDADDDDNDITTTATSTSVPPPPQQQQHPLSTITLRHAMHTIAAYKQQFSTCDHHWLALEHDSLMMRLREMLPMNTYSHTNNNTTQQHNSNNSPNQNRHAFSSFSSSPPSQAARSPSNLRGRATSTAKPSRGMVSSLWGLFRGSPDTASDDDHNKNYHKKNNTPSFPNSDEEDDDVSSIAGGGSLLDVEPASEDKIGRLVFPFSGAAIQHHQRRVCCKLSVAPSLLMYAPEYTYDNDNDTKVEGGNNNEQEEDGKDTTTTTTTSGDDEVVIEGPFTEYMSPLEKDSMRASISRGQDVELVLNAPQPLENVDWSRLGELFGFVRKWSESASEVTVSDLEQHPNHTPCLHPMDLRSRRWFEALRQKHANDAGGGNINPSDAMLGSVLHAACDASVMGQTGATAAGSLQLLPPNFIRAAQGPWVGADLSIVTDLISSHLPRALHPTTSIVRLVAGSNSFSCLYARRLDSVLVSNIIGDVAAGLEALESTMWRFAEVLWDRSRLEKTQFLLTQIGKQRPLPSKENETTQEGGGGKSPSASSNNNNYYNNVGGMGDGVGMRTPISSSGSNVNGGEDPSSSSPSNSSGGVPYTPKVVLMGSSTVMGADFATASAMKAFYTAKSSYSNYRKPIPLTFDQRLIVMRQFLQSAFLTKSPDTILSSGHRRMIQRHLPLHLQSQDWRNVYSTNHHGVSMSQFLAQASAETSSLLVMKVQYRGARGGCITQPIIIGAFIGSKAKLDSRSYHGSGSTFVFRFAPSSSSPSSSSSPTTTTPNNSQQQQQNDIEEDANMEVFRWSHSNNYFLNCRQDMLAVGGPTPAIYVDGSLTEGSTGACDTFLSPSLLCAATAAGEESTTTNTTTAPEGATDGFDILALELCGFGW